MIFEQFQQAVQQDFFRKNMFTVAISSGPGNKISSSISGMVSPLYQDTWAAGALGQFGISTRDVSSFVGDIASKGIDSLMNSTKVGQTFLALGNTTQVQGMMGQFTSGSEMLEWFNDIKQVIMEVHSVKLPDSGFNGAETKTNDIGARTIKLGAFQHGNLSITFRQTPGAKLYQVMKGYVDALYNQETGLYSMLGDLFCNITLNEHNRDGIPILTHVFEKCIPESITGMEYSYDSNNELQTFDVVFRFKKYYTGSLGATNLADWAEYFTGKVGESLARTVAKATGTAAQGLAQGLLNSSTFFGESSLGKQVLTKQTKLNGSLSGILGLR